MSRTTQELLSHFGCLSFTLQDISCAINQGRFLIYEVHVDMSDFPSCQIFHGHTNDKFAEIWWN